MTIQDPFASTTAPADEGQQTGSGPEPTYGIQAAVSALSRQLGEKPLAAPPSEGKIVLTFKEGTGFDSSWIVVHAGTVAEADALLDQSFADLMAKTKRVAAHFRGGSAPTQSASPQRSAAPQGATSPPAWFPPPPAPDWVYKTGFKNGKTWHAWAPAEKGGGDWQFHRQG